ASYGQLAEAMRQHGKVAVAAHYRPRLQEDVIETQSKPELAAASIAQAAASGIVEFPAHGDGAVRSQMFFGKQPNLAWAGADLLGKAPRDDPGRVRWIKYYGPRKTLRSYPYFRV